MARDICDHWSKKSVGCFVTSVAKLVVVSLIFVWIGDAKKKAKTQQ